MFAKFVNIQLSLFNPVMTELRVQVFWWDPVSLECRARVWFYKKGCGSRFRFRLTPGSKKQDPSISIWKKVSIKVLSGLAVIPPTYTPITGIQTQCQGVALQGPGHTLLSQVYRPSAQGLHCRDQALHSYHRYTDLVPRIKLQGPGHTLLSQVYR